MTHLVITDSQSKRWECDISIEGGVITLEPKGYDSSWPFALTFDNTFINNAKAEFKKLGMKKNIRVHNKELTNRVEFIGDGVKEMSTVFKRQQKLTFRDVFKY